MQEPRGLASWAGSMLASMQAGQPHVVAFSELWTSWCVGMWACVGLIGRLQWLAAPV